MKATLMGFLSTSSKLFQPLNIHIVNMEYCNLFRDYKDLSELRSFWELPRVDVSSDQFIDHLEVAWREGDVEMRNKALVNSGLSEIFVSNIAAKRIEDEDPMAVMDSLRKILVANFIRRTTIEGANRFDLIQDS